MTGGDAATYLWHMVLSATPRVSPAGLRLAIALLVVIALLASLPAAASPTQASAASVDDERPRASAGERPPPCPGGRGYWDSDTAVGDRVGCYLHEPDIGSLSLDRSVYRNGDVVRRQFTPAIPLCKDEPPPEFGSGVSDPCIEEIGGPSGGGKQATGLRPRYVDVQSSSTGPFQLEAVWGEDDPACPSSNGELNGCARIDHEYLGPGAPQTRPRDEWIAVGLRLDLGWRWEMWGFPARFLYVEAPLKMDWEDNLVAACDVTPSTSEPGLFHFDGSGSSGGEGLEYEWDFGDGKTGTGFLTKHAYTTPGDYTVTLKVTDNLDNVATTTCKVEVEANELDLSVTVGDGATGRLDPDEEFDVTVRAEVTNDAVGGFKKVVFVDDPLRFPPERFEVVAAPSLPKGPVDLAPGAALTRKWTLKPLVAGKATFRSTVTALDPLGEKVTVEAEATERVGDPVEVEVTLTPDTLTVPETIEEQPAEGGDGEGEPVEVVAAVTITNEGEEDVTGVLWPEKVDVAGIDSSTSPNVRIRAVPGARLPKGEPGAVDMRPFTLSGGETRSVEYLVEVLDDGDFEVKALLQYDDPLGGAPLFALGRKTLGAGPASPLGIKLTTARGDELGMLVGGERIHLRGNIYNFSSTDTLEVDIGSIVPETERNAIVLPYRPLDHDVVEDQCYIPPTNWIIGPGERLPIHGLLMTTSEGATRGAVEFELPDAVAIDEKNVRTKLDPKDYEVSPVPTRFSYQVDTSVEVITEWTAADWATFGGALTYGFIDGGIEWMVSTMRGVVDLVKLVTSWEAISAAGGWLGATTLKTSEMLIDFWFVMGPRQKLAFAADVGQKAYDLAIEAGETVKDAEFQRKAAEAVLPGWFDQIEAAYASNDPRLMGEAFGRVAGNVGLEVASCVLPTPKWMGKYVQLATKAGDEAAEAAAVIGRTAKAGSKSAQKQAARLAIRNGAFIDATTSSTLWGLGSDAYRTLIKFADDNKLLITLRDRGPGSLRRLTEGFIEKMEHMKLKNVNMDIDGPLGYLDSHSDTVAFKKPISKAELDEVLQKVSDPDLRDEIADRWASRSKEWDKYGKAYRSFEQNGFPAGFEYRPNGAVGDKALTRLPFRLNPVKNAAGEVIPDYFVPEVFTEGKWRGFTGDIDIVDIRHASGRSVSKEHARWIYDQLQGGPVNIRHGDTIHWIESPALDAATQFKVKVGQLKDFFVGASDKLLQIAPDGARAVQLDPEKSFVAMQKVGAPSDRGTYATYAGGYKQRLTTVQIAGQTIEASWGNLNPIAPWLAPAHWIIEGGTEENPLGVCEPVASAADGHILRQAESGAGLDVYENGEWTTYDASRCIAPNGRREMSFARAGAAAAAPTALRYAPQSALASTATAGTDLLDVHDLRAIFGDDYAGDWLRKADEILVAPGTDREERHTIAGFDPLRTVQPLAHDHDPDTMVVLVDRPPRSKITVTHKKGAFRGKVGSESPACVARRKVVVKKGKKKIGQTTTNDKGVWKIKKNARPGRYKAMVEPKTVGEIRCLAASRKFKR